ncbi:polyprenyl synthetase family protein [Caulifigura coniformis]|uniref:polyprenyl synthetase family protein n=1 Tax=Caulifigura coniformis TaxID=2527983 RepID=UPI0011A5D7CD|nr:polyprenyl synthetase family protein [Caulifigura coniformis]
MDNAAPHGAVAAKNASSAARSRGPEAHGVSATGSSRSGRNGTFSTMAFPDPPAIRSQLADAAERHAAGLRSGDASTKPQLERLARVVLSDCNQPDKYLGYVMVLLGNLTRRDQFLAVPFSRRLLLHPPGELATTGPLNSLLKRAEQLGYQVLSAEATHDVLGRLLEGRVDAILGLASLEDLERAFDHSVLSGVASFAVPLPLRPPVADDLEGSWLTDVLETQVSARVQEPDGYLAAMRAAARLFREDFERLLPRIHSKTPAAARTPLGMTEDAAYDWLANGGKRFRPFITLAAFDAASGGGLLSGSKADGQPFSDAVCRVAMAIEAFHKASLVHDDIQDDDLFRYGRQTLHRSHGVGPAINIGDYLIGLGYRLVNSCRGELGTDVASDIIESMSQAHLHLCDGQGAEMAWRDHPDWSLTPADAVQMYALKTSPAFEAAMFAGLRLAAPAEGYRDTVTEFCRELGVGFQIVNDLGDWVGDSNNKMVAGQDALALRPTVLLALALGAATDAQRQEIRSRLESEVNDAEQLERLRGLFAELGAFPAAARMVVASRARAQALADSVQPARLRQLFQFLLDTVLPADQPIGLLLENGATADAAS